MPIPGVAKESVTARYVLQPKPEPFPHSIATKEIVEQVRGACDLLDKRHSLTLRQIFAAVYQLINENERK